MSWAEVWSVTASKRTPRRASSGGTSAALPKTAIASGSAPPRRDVAVQHVVGGSLVGDRIEADAAPRQLGVDLGGVAEDGDRERLAAADGVLGPRERFVHGRGHAVHVLELEPPLDALAVDLDDEPDAAVQRDRERLGPAHPADPRGEDEPARQRAAEVLTRAGPA